MRRGSEQDTARIDARRDEPHRTRNTTMKKLIAIFGLMALAACGGDEGAAGENANVDSTASVVPGQDTVQTPTVVPTQDTVVTTTTTSTDTVQGQTQQGAATTDTAAQPH
jgi:hypothetical protein